MNPDAFLGASGLRHPLGFFSILWPSWGKKAISLCLRKREASLLEPEQRSEPSEGTGISLGLCAVPSQLEMEKG